jgi:hypothetical protein
MSIQDEQASNTTIPGEQMPRGARESDPRKRFRQHNQHRLGFAFSLVVMSFLLALGGIGGLVYFGPGSTITRHTRRSRADTKS